MALTFQRAVKSQAKLRLALCGPAGSGKTYSSLLIARQLGGRIALFDTEHGSASKYADLVEFDSVVTEQYSLDTYMQVIAHAKGAGYDVLILDSLSHAWAGKGGALEEVDRVGGSNKFSNGWRIVTPKHNALVDAILSYPGHVLCTLRTKMDYIVEKDDRGKAAPRKVGLAPVARDGVEYEFDVVADLTVDGSVTITKTRCSALHGAFLRHADIPAMATTLKQWLSDGQAKTKPEPQAQPIAVAPPTLAVAATSDAPPPPPQAPTVDNLAQQIAQNRRMLIVDADTSATPLPDSPELTVPVAGAFKGKRLDDPAVPVNVLQYLVKSGDAALSAAARAEVERRGAK